MPALTFSEGPDGRRLVAGAPLSGLASAFGTPLYAIDEDDVRAVAGEFLAAAGDGVIAFSGRALLLGRMLRLAEELGLFLALHSPGELEYALRIGFPTERIILHALGRSAAAIRAAVESGAGHIVVYDPQDLQRLAAAASSLGRTVPVLLALRGAAAANDPAAIAGMSAEEAFSAAELVLSAQSLALLGCHVPVGRTGAAKGDYLGALAQALDFGRSLHARLGIPLGAVDLGEGPEPAGAAPAAAELLDALRALAAAFAGELSLPVPRLMLESGAGLLGRAGILLLRVLSVRPLGGGRRLLVVEGGGSMLGPAHGGFTLAQDRGEGGPCDILGSNGGPGDFMASGVHLPQAAPGDLLVVFGVGAYAHGLASSLGRFGVPPVVFVRGGIARPASRRDALADWLRLETGL